MDKMSGKNPESTAGKPGPSGSRQGYTVKTYLPSKPIKEKKGNTSQPT
jgi:hypothetical protein